MNKAKLLTLFVFCSLSTVAASAQITLKLQRATVQEAIAAINQNANYSIVVNTNDVDLTKRVNVDAKDATYIPASTHNEATLSGTGTSISL